MVEISFVIFSFLALATCVYSAGFNAYDLTKYNSFVKTPITTESIQTGGRIIERHIGYLYEAGFSSILSVVYFPSNDTIYNGVEGSFPSTDYEGVLAAGYGMKAKYIVANFSVESAKEISAVMDSLPRPLYVHCHVGYQANLFTQLHMYLKGEILSSDIYPNSLAMGYDYQNNTDVVNLINSLTGRSDSTHSEQIEKVLANGESSYKSYFWTHRLGNNDLWYNSGQFLDTHVSAISAAGYTTIISFRENQEATARLSSESATGSVPNNEFSDENGLYSVDLEAAAVSSLSIKHIYLPLPSESSSTWTVETYRTYLPQLELAEIETKDRVLATGKGAILVHCASGYRSAAFVLTYLAQKNNLCSDWVFLKAQQIGFSYRNLAPTSHDVEIINFAFSILGC